MKCRELVRSTVETCRDDTPVWRCAEIMRNRKIGFLPVIDPDGRAIGVVTDRDLTTRVLANGLANDVPVRNVMTSTVLVCHVDDDLGVAEERLARAQKSRLVIIDEKGHCVGVVSLSDIAQLETPPRAGRVVAAVTRREAQATRSELDFGS